MSSEKDHKTEERLNRIESWLKQIAIGLGINLEDVSTSSTPRPNVQSDALSKYRSKIRKQLFQ